MKGETGDTWPFNKPLLVVGGSFGGVYTYDSQNMAWWNIATVLRNLMNGSQQENVDPEVLRKAVKHLVKFSEIKDARCLR